MSHNRFVDVTMLRIYYMSIGNYSGGYNESPVAHVRNKGECADHLFFVAVKQKGLTWKHDFG